MSGLTIHNDVEQKSDEWFALRRGIITASAVGQLITPKTVKVASNDNTWALTALLVSERITGWTEPTFTSAEMERGNMDEPLARDLYSKTYAQVEECGFMTHDFGGFVLGYSPDGLVGDDGLIEVKSRAPKRHVKDVVSGEVPPENMAQIQCGMLVSGRKWCDYLSYCGGMQMWRKRVHPDATWVEAIIEAANSFEGWAQDMQAAYAAAVEGMPTTERIEYFPEVTF